MSNLTEEAIQDGRRHADACIAFCEGVDTERLEELTKHGAAAKAVLSVTWTLWWNLAATIGDGSGYCFSCFGSWENHKEPCELHTVISELNGARKRREAQHETNPT